MAETVQLYKNFHERMDDIEERVNNGLRDLLILDLVKFVDESKKAQKDIAKLKNQPPKV